MSDPYGQLAPLYDRMAADPGIRGLYREFRRALTDAAAARGLRPGVIVDLACGTGNTAIPWARARGRTVIGVDVSEAMLRVARKKSRCVRWVKQDAELRRMLRGSGLQLEEIRVMRRLKGRPIRKLYVAVKRGERRRAPRPLRPE